jgi:hypothetical protein
MVAFAMEPENRRFGHLAVINRSWLRANQGKRNAWLTLVMLPLLVEEVMGKKLLRGQRTSA